MPHVRLQEVAQAAGVSVVTASKVLSPNSTGNNTKVSTATSERIREIARQLGYRPNLAARQLAGGSSRLIGLLLYSQSSPMEFARAAYVEEAAARRGFRVVICQCGASQESVRFCLDDFAAHGVDGAILLANAYPDLNEWIIGYARRLRHVVYYDRPLCDDGTCDYVEVDLTAGVRQLVDHLYAAGRRKIVYFLPYPEFPHGKYPSLIARERGFMEGMEAHGLPYDHDFAERFHFKSLPGNTELVRCAAEFIRVERPDAVITRNDNFAVVVLRALHESGLRCPEDVALAGYDNFEFTENLVPSLTTVDNRLTEVSECAVGMLVERIEKRGTAERRAEIFTPRLIVRESTGAGGRGQAD